MEYLTNIEGLEARLHKLGMQVERMWRQKAVDVRFDVHIYYYTEIETGKKYFYVEYYVAPFIETLARMATNLIAQIIEEDFSDQQESQGSIS
jgi:hypothetical protein